MNEVNVFSSEDLAALFPKRRETAHKGDFGYVGIMGGSPEFGGAVKLANLALSALRCGAGVARLIIPEGLYGAVAPYILESTLFLLPDRNSGRFLFDESALNAATDKLSSLAFGMGAGNNAETLKIAEYLLSRFGGTLVLDADALNALSATDKSVLRKRTAPLVLTPHVKEMSRLCGLSVEKILGNPAKTAYGFAKEFGATVLLKGHTTYVSDGISTYAVEKGSAGMATGGSGDVLSGILAGLCGFIKNPLLAAAAGAFINGAAGEAAANSIGEYGTLPSDTVFFIAPTVKKIIAGEIL